MSQLCGSGLSRRSNVTSAARTADVLASSTPANAASPAVDFIFIVASLGLQPEHEQHGGVRQRLHLGRARELGPANHADAGGNSDVLLAVHHVGDWRRPAART